MAELKEIKFPIRLSSECKKLLIIDPEVILEFINIERLDLLLEKIFITQIDSRMAVIEVEPWKPIECQFKQ